MNGHLPRGLPPIPGHSIHFDHSRPPPAPRELYAQDNYASIQEQYQMDQKKQAPPPPRRNPDTRLSSATPSSSVSSYEEVHDRQFSPPHSQSPQHGHQSPQHGSQLPRRPSAGSPVLKSRMEHSPQHAAGAGPHSPRRAVPGSPVPKSTMDHGPQSPNFSGNRPFSYGAVLPPKLHHVDSVNTSQTVQNSVQTGHPQYNVPNSNYQYTDQYEGNTALSYERHESAFYPQPVRPAPQGPPPPPPSNQGLQSNIMQGHGYLVQGQGHSVVAPQPQYHGSPKMQRHSVTPIQGNVQQMGRPRSPQLVPKLSQRSKSVPCGVEDETNLPPPPPLLMRDSSMSAYQSYRSSSPPLPPPPPELLEDLPPPPRPPPVMPQLQQNQMLTNPPYVPVPKQSLPSTQSNLPSHSSAPPPPPPVSSIPRKKTDQPQPRPPNVPAQPKIPNVVPAVTVPGSRLDTGYLDQNGNQLPSVLPSRIPSDPMMSQPQLLHQITNVQLKKTGIKITQEVEVEPELPEAVPEPPPAQEDRLPVEMEEEPIPQVSQAAVMFEKKAEQIARSDQPVGRKAPRSSMDFNIDDIDLNDVPGYTPVTKSTPIWKRDMIEKKNQEKIEEYIKQKQKEKEEAEKWKNVPEWKRKLMMEKEKEKAKKTEDELKKAAEEEANRKRRDKEAEEARKAKIKEQQEMERKMQEEMQDVPEWKREIMMKRGGAIRNWGDEREEDNIQEDGDENAVTEPRDAQPSPTPQPIQTSKQSPQKSPSKDSHGKLNSASPQQPKSTQDTPPKMPVSQTQQKDSTPGKEEKKPTKRCSLDEAKLEEEWDTLPLWKREILMKRGGAPSNWGDEREEVNEEEQ